MKILICTALNLSTIALFCLVLPMTKAFSSTTNPNLSHRVATTGTSLGMAKGNKEEYEKKSGGGIFSGFKGMLDNFDDVVDDFLFKRMGAGEQWYGKRKYNPSGKYDGDYNGMGRSDFYRIEIAKIQKEEMEKRRQRRIEEEEAARK